MSSNRLCWRKLVKKIRRKRIRQAKATESKEMVRTDSDESDEAQTEREEQERLARHQIWLQEEQKAQKIWQDKENARKNIEEEKKAVQERIRKEWEAAREQKVEKKKAEELEMERIKLKIDLFIKTGGEVPQELLTRNESNPGREVCPFFKKVGSCRFGPSCSRNHIIPGLSKTILIPNCYAHFMLSQHRSSEYGTDVKLEFDEQEMNQDFREFFEDFVPELELFGCLRIVQVCCNSENHLRGNLYAEYSEMNEALAAARALNARWYGGRQLTVNFVNLEDWGAAVCGDFRKRSCPKGDHCNFLHTFCNPRGRFMYVKRQQELSRSWRWSQSPDRILRRSHSRSRKSRTKSPSRHKKTRSRSPTRHRKTRSRSPTRHRKTRSRSPSRHRKTRSRSPAGHKKTRSRSPSRHRKTRSKSPMRHRKTRSRSPSRHRKTRSKSPSRKRMSRSSNSKSPSPIKNSLRDVTPKSPSSKTRSRSALTNIKAQSSPSPSRNIKSPHLQEVH